jgi:sugar (pentulose or hexulose) kinase
VSAGLLLGIDVGTSACKAAVVDDAGAELSHGQAPTPWETVPTGAQIEPDSLFGAAVIAAREALAGAPEGPIAGIGVTSMAETGVLLDARDAVMHPAIAWHDTRGTQEAREIEPALPAFPERTGLPATELCTLAKLLHLGAERLRGARRWLSVGEWVVRRLGGNEVAELSLASRTGLFDVHAGGPYTEALELAGVREDLLGEPVVAGTAVGRHDGGALPAARGAILTVAGHDHLAAGVGVGVVAPGDVLDSCGTAEALLRVVAPPLGPAAIREAVAGGVSVGHHVTPGRQAVLGGVWSGLALREVLDTLGVGDAGRDELDAAALAIAPGEGSAFELNLRSLHRERPSLPDAEPAAVWRAAIDAVARDVERVIDHIDAVAGPHTKVVVTGGWARSAAVLDAKRRLGAVEAPPVIEAGCRGAALLAGVATGLYRSADELPAVPVIAKEPT